MSEVESRQQVKAEQTAIQICHKLKICHKNVKNINKLKLYFHKKINTELSALSAMDHNRY